MGDFLVSVICENFDIPHVEPLETNGHNLNFIILSDSSWYGGDSVKSGDNT